MMLQNLYVIVTTPLMLFEDFNKLLIEMDKGICLFDAVLCYDSSSLGNKGLPPKLIFISLHVFPPSLHSLQIWHYQTSQLKKMTSELLSPLTLRTEEIKVMLWAIIYYNSSPKIIIVHLKFERHCEASFLWWL